MIDSLLHKNMLPPSPQHKNYATLTPRSINKTYAKNRGLFTFDLKALLVYWHRARIPFYEDCTLPVTYMRALSHGTVDALLKTLRQAGCRCREKGDIHANIRTQIHTDQHKDKDWLIMIIMSIYLQAYIGSYILTNQYILRQTDKDIDTNRIT